MTNPEIELHTRKQQNELWIDISIFNQRGAPVLIEKSDGRISQLFEEAFEVHETRNDSLVPYIGAVTKKKAYTLADFERLNPGGNMKKTIRIDNAYALSVDTTSYRIRWRLLVWEHEENAVGTVTTEWQSFSWP